MLRLTTRLLAAASAFALTGGAALAQDATVQEIVVTAQKREQAALDVPMSLTAYSAERLEELGVQDFADVALFTPGFEVQEQSPNNPGFVVRGITSDETSAYSEARVSVFQDGVSISKAQGSYVELFDLERIEVAKGPQSTLFGRGALIGGVNIIQRKADPSGFDGYLRAEGGDYSYALAEGAVNIPLSEAFALRFSGRMRQRDGYVGNALGGDDFQSVDSWAGRISAHFEPNERLSSDFIVNYQRDEPAGTAFKSGGYSPTDPATGKVLAGRGASEPAALRAPNNFEGGRELGLERTVWGVTALVDYEINDALSLSSISAVRRFDSEETFDPDGISLNLLTGLNDAVGEQWSQELRLNYDAGGRVRGFVGAGYFHAEDRQRLPLQFDERMAIAQLAGVLNGGPALGLPATTPAPEALFADPRFIGQLVQGVAAQASGGRLLLTPAQGQAIAANLRANHVEEAVNTSELDSFDLFGDVSFDVTDRFEVSAGLRYTRDDKTTGFGSRTVGGRSVLGGVIGASGLAAGGSPQGLAQANAIMAGLQSPMVQAIPTLPMFGLTFQPTSALGTPTEREADNSGFTWRLVGRYKLSDDANLYASYARGRLPEVLAASAPANPYDPARFAEIEAETVDSYEVGAKAALWDRRLRLDTAAYFYDYDNFQTVEQQGTLFVVTNAGKAEAYGVEAQAELAVVSGLDLFATYAYSHARFKDGAYDGNRFRLSPDHSLSLGADWRFAALGGEVSVRPTYTWQSKVFFSDDNDRAMFQQPPRALVADNIQDELQDAYGLANLRVSWTAASRPLTLEAFVNNITDEEYLIDAGNTGDSLGMPTFVAGPPRMWGVGLTWKFR
ncbi:TonB-dependent receptor [Phenylobacterium koreense]|uniref:Outer membrane receptor protein involved in Fe transport n=3 Tax=Phenylobacterium TaxID=20 RepID=A0ABV2EDV2_9CAUL